MPSTTHNGTWECISAGSGPDVVLLLPGALGIESARALVDVPGATHRVIAPLYGDASNMRGMCDALVKILEAEGAERAHVVASSYGGVVAQHFAHDQPTRVRGIVLSHTFVLRPEHAWRFRLGIRAWRRIPARLMRSLLRRRLERLVLDPLRANDHPDLPKWTDQIARAPAKMLEDDSALLRQHVLLDATEHWPLAMGTSSDLTRRMLIVQSGNDHSRAGARGTTRVVSRRSRAHVSRHRARYVDHRDCGARGRTQSLFCFA
ncbi:MAG: alpha/beta hydrolase [Gemmatimonadota bacterium]|nr:alpha/beta hydrolase [Gemmatimonadota bacterium]